MEQVDIHIKSLENILRKTTPEYLKETSLTELKHKLIQAHEATEKVKEEWESVDISDFPESDTIGWETKKRHQSTHLAKNIRIRRIGSKI